MGVVYEAVEGSLGRRVALKVLPFAAAIDPRQIARFRVEAQAASQLNHPHIVPVFSVGCEGGIHYYAMQLIDGPTLAQLIAGLRHQDGLDDATRTRAMTAPVVEPANGPAEEGPGQDFAIVDSAPDSHWAVLQQRPVPPAEPPAPSTWPLGSTATRDRSFFREVARLGARPRWRRARAPAGRPAPRRQAVEPDGRRPGASLGHRLRPGAVPGRGEPDGARRHRWARCAT